MPSQLDHAQLRPSPSLPAFRRGDSWRKASLRLSSWPDSHGAEKEGILPRTGSGGTTPPPLCTMGVVHVNVPIPHTLSPFSISH
jgi:hypothetical protein